jgi:hypothetical protein
MRQFSLADKTINFTKSATKFLPDLGQVFYFGAGRHFSFRLIFLLNV